VHDASRLVAFGAAIRNLRQTLGLTQHELAKRIGRSQTFVSAVERGVAARLEDRDADALCRALGGTFVFGVEAPLLLGGGRAADAAHARCVAHVVRRLPPAGWIVEREVEIGSGSRPGWIDVLAFHPASRVVLVVEVKSEVLDVGQVERQLGWYEREASIAARRMGWRPAAVFGCLLVLATDRNDQLMRENRVAFAAAFPIRGRPLADVLAGGPLPVEARRGIALIDPRSKARRWCRPTVLDGRRSTAPYRNYADFIRAIGRRRRRSGRGSDGGATAASR
jgi:transcriptional regulator with XRE-family HTH domain